jgi:DNA-binding IclR family transcriptional regulator
MRSGLEAVCVVRVEGSHPIKTLTLDIGSRRPLGVGGGGLAISAACPVEEANWIVRSVGQAIRKFGKLTPARLAQAVAEARELGYATVTNQVQFGVTGVGVAFCDAGGLPVGAISVGAVNERLSPQRRPQVVGVLRKAARDVERGLAAMPVRP